MFESTNTLMTSSLQVPTSNEMASSPRRPSLGAFKYPGSSETTTHTGQLPRDSDSQDIANVKQIPPLRQRKYRMRIEDVMLRT